VALHDVIAVVETLHVLACVCIVEHGLCGWGVAGAELQTLCRQVFAVATGSVVLAVGCTRVDHMHGRQTFRMTGHLLWIVDFILAILQTGGRHVQCLATLLHQRILLGVDIGSWSSGRRSRIGLFHSHTNAFLRMCLRTERGQTFLVAHCNQTFLVARERLCTLFVVSFRRRHHERGTNANKPNAANQNPGFHFALQFVVEIEIK